MKKIALIFMLISACAWADARAGHKHKPRHKEQGLPVHAKAPDIILPSLTGMDPDANKTNYRYLLINFWASWSKPSRADVPALIKTFGKYQSKGFQVMAVSIDADIDQWHTAIKSDGTINFIQLNDPAAFNCTYIKRFKVEELPANFLIDNEGTIIAKNLHGIELDNELAKLTGGH